MNYLKTLLKRIKTNPSARLSRPHSRRLALENLEERALLAVDAGFAMAALAEPASTEYVVTTLADTVNDTDGVLSLREAIAAAAEGDTITFDASLKDGTITLAGTQLKIDKGITIDASSINGMTIDAHQESRIFYVSGAAEANPIQLIGLTIQNGTEYEDGGGIYNSSALTLTDCTISGNSAEWSNGGGIYNGKSGTLTLINCNVSGNSSSGWSGGGGIYNEGTITLTDCALSGNSTTGKHANGGGIYNYYDSTVTLTNCTVSGNSTTGDDSNGGGIYNDYSGTVTLTGCTVSENSATSNGGGGYNEGTLTLTDCAVLENSAESSGGIDNDGELTLTNCTVSGNSATGDRAGGGGIGNGGTVTLTDCTVSENSAGYGGGIFNSDTVTLTNCAVSGNSAEHGGGIGNDGELTLTNCAVSENSANGNGGGIGNYGTFTLTNSTVSGNSAKEGFGGGINNEYELTLTNSVVSGNSAKEGFGGGIYNFTGALTLTNSIVVVNYAYRGSNIYGTYTSSYSYIGNFDPGFVCAPVFDDSGVLTNAETLDLHLKSSSWLINTGNNSAVSVEDDLDGNPRIYDGVVDLGAYEYQQVISEREAVSLVVTTEEDSFDPFDGKTSLREAIYHAQTGETITFDASLAGKVITLCGAELTIDKGITIDAASIGGITIDANQKSRVFYMVGGTDANPIQLIGLTIQNGKVSGSGGGICNSGTLTLMNCAVSGDSAYYGGGIYNEGTLTLTNCAVSGNSADNCGGGIYNYSGTFTLTNCAVSGNSTTGNDSNGGGIYNYGWGTFTLMDCVVSENSTYYGGGGIYNEGTFTLTNCAVSGNSVNNDGGGIYNCGWNTFTLTNCAVSGNSADRSGGGIYSCNSGTITLTNCAVSGNSAGWSNGGGIYNDSELTLTNCTVSGNSADFGGGIYNSYSGTVTLTNSIVSVNYTSYSNPYIDGTYTSSYSYIDNFDPGFVCAPIFDDSGVLTNADTLDLHLKSSSWLINIGDNSAVSVEDDLEGNPRIYGNVVDLGAYEYQQAISERETVSLIVTTEEDSFDASDGKTSLREAIYHAQTGETITFAASLAGKVITLCGAELTIDKGITIDASSIGGITIDANQKSRVFDVIGETDANSVQLIGLTIQNGKAYSGGGIFNSGALTLTNCAVSGNSATGDYVGGGGIYNSGALTLTNCTVSGNSATGVNTESGGIYNSYGTVNSYNSIITRNTARLFPYDIYKNRGTINGYNTLSSWTSWDGGSGNMEYDSSKPLFTDEENGDYTLAADSQAMNVGCNDYVTTETDLAGNPRINSGIVDLGAYEFPYLMVTTLADTVDDTDGVLSLREAIAAAEEGDTITFAASLKDGTITLTGTELKIYRGITIDATSICGMTIDANQASRVFYVFNGTESNPIQLIDLTIQNGNEYDGGGICNCGTLTLTNCAVSGNSAAGDHNARGGGICNYGTLTLTSCAVSGNSAAGDHNAGGGGICNYGTLTLTNCAVSGNSAAGDYAGGGGIDNCDLGTITLTNCAVSRNSAAGDYAGGGGIDNCDSGTITLMNCAVSGNSASSSGGGIGNGGTLTLTNSIVSINYASSNLSNIAGGYTSSYSYIGNFDPGFVCAPVFDDSGVLTNAETIDLHLKSSSWLINAGDNSAVSVEDDLDGNPRIYGDVVDLGIYEYQQSISERETISLVVTTEEDSFDPFDGKTSLREAIYHAQTGETITFDASLAGKVITLCGAELTIDKGITIDAVSIGGITIDANQKSRVFDAIGGTDANPIQLIDLTIQNGKALNSGGGIYNSGTLTLTNCAVSGNKATGSNAEGGGICNYGTLTLTNCTISGNSAHYCGGGIYSSYGTLTLTNCVVSGNSAPNGGGIYNSSYSTFTLTNCTVSGNSAYYGGGIANDSTLTLTNSIVSANYVSFMGSNVYGRYTSSYSYIGNFDPGFVCAPIFNNSGILTNAETLDFHLKSSSWLINAGDNGAVSVEDDLDGNPRIYGDAVDLGVYEYQQSISEREVVSLVITTEEDSFDPFDGKTSLREAIYHAQTGETITFDASLTGKIITLCGAELTIDKGITIDAVSIGGITIDANQKSRVFDVINKTKANPVQLIGLTIQNGKVSSSGGGIYNSGTLTLTNCAVSGNSVTGSDVEGGGIYNSGTLTLTNCAVSGNKAMGYNAEGGGIYNSGTLTLTNCTVSGNSVTGSDVEGGGIYNSYYGTVTLTNCTVSGNSATGNDTSGGGIYNYSYNRKINSYNSIIALNTTNSSISDIYNYKSSGTINGYNTLSSWTAWDEGSGNLEYDSSKPLFTDAENGDYTLAADSQAMNVGCNDYVTTETDLAGNARINGGVVDLGAYEYNGPKVSISIVLSETAPTGAARSELEESLALTYTGRTVYAQVWMKNVDGSTNGITGGYMDLHYDSAAFSVSSVTSGAYYAAMNNYYTLTDGVVTCFGGMAEMGQTGYGTDEWVLLGCVAMTVTGAGDSTISVSTPTMGGEAAEGLNIARNIDGVLKSSQIKFGSQAIETIQVVPLAVPANLTVVTGGANRAQASWDAVENASGYTLAYSTDGGVSWATADVTETSYQITGLTYGASVSYKVMAKGNGAEWSDSVYTDVVSLKVCPMDIGGDGVINMNDYAVVSQAWFSRPGSSNWNSRADVDGDGIIGPGDFTFLSANWLKKTDDSSIIYPAAKAATFADGDFVEELGTDLDIDWEVF